MQVVLFSPGLMDGLEGNNLFRFCDLWQSMKWSLVSKAGKHQLERKKKEKAKEKESVTLNIVASK